MHFLLVYDRSAGRLLQPPLAFERRPEAMQARFEAEETHAGDSNVEAIVFDAASLDGLRHTHARYFLSLAELTSQGATATRSAPEAGRFHLPTHIAG